LRRERKSPASPIKRLLFLHRPGAPTDERRSRASSTAAYGDIRGVRGRRRLAVEAFGRTLRELARTAERDGVAATCIEGALASGLVERLGRESSEHAEEQLEQLRRFCRAAHNYEARAERPRLADS
jgi:hypothetical protein